MTGVVELVDSITGTNLVGNRWLWGVSGVLSVLFGVLLIGSPIMGLYAVVWVIRLLRSGFRLCADADRF